MIMMMMVMMPRMRRRYDSRTMGALLYTIVAVQLVCHLPRTGLNIYEIYMVGTGTGTRTCVTLWPGPGGGRDIPELGLAGGHLPPAARRSLGCQRGHLRCRGENTTVLCSGLGYLDKQ